MKDETKIGQKRPERRQENARKNKNVNLETKRIGKIEKNNTP